MIACGEQKDIDALVSICRMCFPRSLRWHGNRSLAEKWWETVLSASGAEVYVIRKDGQIVAFCLLVTDEYAFNTVMSRLPVSWWRQILCLAQCPLVVLRKAVTFLRRRLKSRERLATCPMPTDWSPEHRTWIELIAVSPLYRRKGYASMLMKHCDSRSLALGRTKIGLKADEDNTSSRMFYESLGFTELWADAGGCCYGKSLQ